MSINIEEFFAYCACIIIMCDAFLDKVNHHFVSSDMKCAGF